jgi:hypothetical protein
VVVQVVVNLMEVQLTFQVLLVVLEVAVLLIHQ